MVKDYTTLNDFRYERKFVSDISNQGQVDILIRQNPEMFGIAFPSRQVNNIYFDTPGLDCYFDNLFGHGKRWKARIRWYENLYRQISQPVLELKIKHGHLGTKNAWQLKPLNFSGTLNDTLILKDTLSESNLPEDVKNRLLCMQPVLVNNYQRSYFVSASKKFRLTVDTQLEYCDFRSFKKSNTQIFKETGKIVVELKYSKEHDNRAGLITNYIPFRLNKNSKFVSGMNFLRPGVAN